ncbi:MAG: hypothetical protein DRO88_09065 [Promethearchaeia archaeon]|nr:MAG: hypothetical protein DRO88_09065 [Candidatus Lokiarchaeia archaeon]
MSEFNLRLSELQKQIHEIIMEFGGYWDPLVMLAAVVEEVGELSREITHFTGIKPKKTSEFHKSGIFQNSLVSHDSLDYHQSITALSEELGDTMFSLICIANYYKIDLEKIMPQILLKYKNRDKNRFSSHEKIQ